MQQAEGRHGWPCLVYKEVILFNWHRLVERVTTPKRFEYAVNIVLKHEGGLTNDAHDPGGITKYGISQRFLDGCGDGLKAASLTREQAIELYKHYWWDAHHYEGIKSLKIATKIFDLAVNMGAHEAHMIAQKAINDFATHKIVIDGALGPISISTINKSNDNLMMKYLRLEAEWFYLDLIKRRPENAVFKDGWLTRAQW